MVLSIDVTPMVDGGEKPSGKNGFEFQASSLFSLIAPRAERKNVRNSKPSLSARDRVLISRPRVGAPVPSWSRVFTSRVLAASV